MKRLTHYHVSPAAGPACGSDSVDDYTTPLPWLAAHLAELGAAAGRG
jgi:hypothetical protein